MSRDPIEELGGLNVYGFVRNSHFRMFDVLGMYEASAEDYWRDLSREEYKRKLESLNPGFHLDDIPGPHWGEYADLLIGQ